MAVTLSAEEYGRRLVRARQWHLFQAGFQRRAAASAVIQAALEVERHEDEAARIAQQLRELGLIDPNAPVTPGSAA